MITFESFIMREGSPIYLQILLYIKRGIIAGSIKDGDELPSRRVLSALLGINPNTVQKAFTELERSGVAYSVSGKGRFVTDDVESLKKNMIKNSFKSIKQPWCPQRSFKL